MKFGKKNITITSLQLITYKLYILKTINPDKPRNSAETITIISFQLIPMNYMLSKK